MVLELVLELVLVLVAGAGTDAGALAGVGTDAGALAGVGSPGRVKPRNPTGKAGAGVRLRARLSRLLLEP